MNTGYNLSKWYQKVYEEVNEVTMSKMKTDVSLKLEELNHFLFSLERENRETIDNYSEDVYVKFNDNINNYKNDYIRKLKETTNSLKETTFDELYNEQKIRSDIDRDIEDVLTELLSS